MTYGYTRGANRLAILILSSLFAGGTALLIGCGTTPVASSSSGTTTPAPPPSTPAPPPPAGSSSAAATPSFSPAPGVYSSAQTVTISDSTAGAAIYYTTDGTTPSTSSTQYTQPITVGSTATLKAISTATGYSSSAAASATYTINIGAAGGTSLPTKIVTIADAVPGVTIYYTTDGTTPTTSSAQYTGPITIDSTSTIKAIAVANGYTNSAVGVITVSDPGSSQAATPTLSPSAGIYSGAQTVAISDSTAGAVIYYTTDGTTPTTNSTQYSGAIQVSSSETINAIAVATGYANSATASATYTLGSAAKSP